MVSSIGCWLILSGILASSTLIAIRSIVIPGLPPAWPTLNTASGFTSLMTSFKRFADSLNTVGNSKRMSSTPSISGRAFTHSIEGLIFSPPKGSNPVTIIFITSLYFGLLFLNASTFNGSGVIYVFCWPS